VIVSTTGWMIVTVSTVLLLPVIFRVIGTSAVVFLAVVIPSVTPFPMAIVLIPSSLVSTVVFTAAAVLMVRMVVSRLVAVAEDTNSRGSKISVQSTCKSLLPAVLELIGSNVYAMLLLQLHGAVYLGKG